MRLSTALTFALLVLLVVAAVGTVTAASPSTPSDDMHSTDPSAELSATPTLHPSTASLEYEMSGLFGTDSDTSSPVFDASSQVWSTSALDASSQQSNSHRSTTRTTTGQSFDPNATALESPTPEQSFHITVTEDGDAEWTIESYFLLTDEDDIALFYDYAGDVTAGDRPVGYDRSKFEQFAAMASETTNREMAIEDAGWNAPENRSPDDFIGLQNAEELADDDVQIGVISYSITWTNFAAVDGDRLYFGDAFRTDEGEGTWFPGLTAGQQLVVESPENYGFDDAPSGYHYSEGGAFVWNGPHEFDIGDLDIVFLRGADDGAVLGMGFYVGIGIVVVLVGIGGYLLALRTLRVEWPFDDDAPAAGAASVPNASSATDAGQPIDNGNETTESIPEMDESATDDPSATEFEYEEGEDSEDIDVELLSDEERIQRMLRQNGGRMKQAKIVDDTDWSNAKVSQLLSRMDDEGAIEKLRIGRENLITLPEVDPTEIE